MNGADYHKDELVNGHHHWNENSPIPSRKSMNRDEQKSEIIPYLFPCIYFGLAAFYSCFDIYALGNYEQKHGQPRHRHC
jgi:hypothetical protein